MEQSGPWKTQSKHWPVLLEAEMRPLKSLADFRLPKIMGKRAHTPGPTAATSVTTANSQPRNNLAHHVWSQERPSEAQ